MAPQDPRAQAEHCSDLNTLPNAGQEAPLDFGTTQLSDVQHRSYDTYNHTATCASGDRQVTANGTDTPAPNGPGVNTHTVTEAADARSVDMTVPKDEQDIHEVHLHDVAPDSRELQGSATDIDTSSRAASLTTLPVDQTHETQDPYPQSIAAKVSEVHAELKQIKRDQDATGYRNLYHLRESSLHQSLRVCDWLSQEASNTLPRPQMAEASIHNGSPPRPGGHTGDLPDIHSDAGDAEQGPGLWRRILHDIHTRRREWNDPTWQLELEHQLNDKLDRYLYPQNSPGLPASVQIRHCVGSGADLIDWPIQDEESPIIQPVGIMYRTGNAYMNSEYTSASSTLTCDACCMRETNTPGCMPEDRAYCLYEFMRPAANRAAGSTCLSWSSPEYTADTLNDTSELPDHSYTVIGHDLKG